MANRLNGLETMNHIIETIIEGVDFWPITTICRNQKSS